MTDGDEQRELGRIETLPLEERADAYRVVQRRLQDELERPARSTGA